MDPVRHTYRCRLSATWGTGAPEGLTMWPGTGGEDDVLGLLMEEAYAGTIDEQLGDNTDGAVEIANWREFVADEACSRIARTLDGETVGASLVGRWQGTVFIAYVITLPAWKRRGVGAAVLAASLRALRDAGDEQVEATITEGNESSERLFARLGFRRVEGA